MNPEIEKILKRALVGLKMGADLAYATETTDSQAAMAGAVCVKIESIEEEVKAFLGRTLETQYVPGNPGCTIFFKSQREAAGTADEKRDRSAENAAPSRPEPS